MNYKVSPKPPLPGHKDMRIDFNPKQWPKFLLWILPSRIGRVKAQVRYKYEDMERGTLPVDGPGEDTKGVWTVVEEVPEKTITAFSKEMRLIVYLK
jgi:hypothetical protein